jgi:glycosyltransferase involved in cell wall biosynthesis
MLIDLKGQQELVPAMAKVVASLPGATLLLVGDGENRAKLERLIDEHGLRGRVRLLGHRQDVAALLQLADGLISASRSEGFGMAVLEAMAAAKAVVAVHTPAFEEFARDGHSAVFVARQDRELLADAIVDVFGDRRRVAALGEAARQDAERFRVEHTAARLLDILERVARPA